MAHDSRKSDIYDNESSRVRFEAYSRLQASAVAFGESLPIPEIVAIGGQSDGKSSLMEAFLGFRFNVKDVEMGTRRPLIVQMVHDPTALEPRCRLQEEDSDDYGPVIMPESSVSEAIRTRTEAHLRQMGGTVSAKPIVLRAEFAYCPNLTIIDTPGFILKARKGEAESTPDDIMAMVKDQVAPPNRLILFLQQSSVEWCSSMWMHLIQEVDPTYQRTVVVASKFDNRLKEFSERWEVDKYLSAAGYLPANVRPFFVALPKDRTAQTSRDWRSQIQQVDSQVLQHLRGSVNGGFDEEHFGSQIGFSNLRKFLEEELARRYRDAAPATLAVLQERCEAAAAELVGAEGRLRAASDVTSLRRAGMQHVFDVAGALASLLSGAVEPNPQQHGLTTEEERSLSHAPSWPGVQPGGDVQPANSGLRLFGGAAFERVMDEFQRVAQSVAFPQVGRDKVANVLLAYRAKGLRSPGMQAAQEIARGIAKDCLGPLLDVACARLAAVLRRSFEIAVEQASAAQRPATETLRPYVAFHAALRNCYHALISRLEAQCKSLLKHHLEVATSGFAMGMFAEEDAADIPAFPRGVGEENNAPPALTAAAATRGGGPLQHPHDVPMEDAAPGAGHAAVAAMAMGGGHGGRRPPLSQMTVPETPSPDQLPNEERRGEIAAAAGRNVDALSPGKGRVPKSQRLGSFGFPAGQDGSNHYAAVVAESDRLFRRVRGSVACRAAPATLKSAFLEPLAGQQLPAELSLELFAVPDPDFMAMFSVAGAMEALQSRRDTLARRVEGLVKCKNEFQELARAL